MTNWLVTYIPELANAQSESFGLSVGTLDGYVYGAGDWEVPPNARNITSARDSINGSRARPNVRVNTKPACSSAELRRPR
jgi:hypothetical protein